MYFDGNTNEEIFKQWIEEFLTPSLKQNQTIILDNTAFHKSQKTIELIEAVKCNVLYLPPYSSDLNPIQQKWDHVKNLAKKIRGKF